MGTSVSQPSPKSTPWRAVNTCYESDSVPLDRTTNEIWQAATSETEEMQSQIVSPAVFACYQVAQQQISIGDLHTALDDISSRQGNSLIVEYAKRATIVASQSANPAEQWPKQFFKELTTYLVSRDTSGFVGPNSRSKTVSDLIALKQDIGRQVEATVGRLNLAPKTAREWSQAAISALKALAGR